MSQSTNNHFTRISDSMSFAEGSKILFTACTLARTTCTCSVRMPSHIYHITNQKMVVFNTSSRFADKKASPWKGNYNTFGGRLSQTLREDSRAICYGVFLSSRLTIHFTILSTIAKAHITKCFTGRNVRTKFQVPCTYFLLHFCFSLFGFSPPNGDTASHRSQVRGM